jgi:hypothetical protein
VGALELVGGESVIKPKVATGHLASLRQVVIGKSMGRVKLVVGPVANLMAIRPICALMIVRMTQALFARMLCGYSMPGCALRKS